jgi:hypothetical protein
MTRSYLAGLSRPGARRIRPVLTRGVIGLLLFTVAVSAGCSPTEADSSTSSAPGPAPAGGPGAVETPTPLVGLLQVAEDSQRVLHEADERAVAACMKEQGFRYEPLPFKPATPARQPLGDVAAARSRGYGLAESKGETQGPRPEEEQTTQGLTPAEKEAWRTALIGKAVGPHDLNRPGQVKVQVGNVQMSYDSQSCVAKGHNAVFGDNAEWTRLRLAVTELSNKVYNDTMSDPALEPSIAKWRSCMQAKGYKYERPLAPSEALATQLHDGTIDRSAVKDLEIKIATADAECAQSEGVVDAVRSVMAAREQKEIEANQGLVLAFQEMQKASVERARANLAGGR